MSTWGEGSNQVWGRVLAYAYIKFSGVATWEGHCVQLLSRASLIKMKGASNRLKDQLDVELLNDQTDER